MPTNLLFFTNSQKILSFLIANSDKEFYDREISKLTGVSRAGTNFALRDLYKSDLVTREKRGRMYFYKVQLKDILIRYLKIVQNISCLRQLVNKLKNCSIKIILYGSASSGDNASGSDIDLFIMSRTPSEVEKIIFKNSLREKIKYTTSTPNNYIKSKKNNSVFYSEVEKGIVLWQEKGI